MVIASQRTMFLEDMLLRKIFNNKYNIHTNTTLNEKFNTNADYFKNNDVIGYPNIKYFAIGIGGNTVLSNSNGYKFCSHSPMDGALFNHIPFIMREVDNDIEGSLRNNYRLRVIENHNNKNYACYYLKVAPDVNVRNDFLTIETRKDIASGEKLDLLSLLDTNKYNILNPTPKPRALEYISVDEKRYVTKLAKLEFLLYNSEILELRKVLNILNIKNATLSELGICMGYDIEEGEYKEAVGVQMSYHVSIDLDFILDSTYNDNLLKSIELGGYEALTLGDKV